ncbi:MAG: FtsX-like permease family protein [Jatrophihabitans sp.]
MVDPPGPGAVRYAVVGTYDPARSAASRPAVGDPSPGFGDLGAPVLVFSVVGLGRVPMELSVSARSMVVAARLRLDQEPAVRASAAAVRQAALAQSVPLAFSSGFAGPLDRVDADRRAVGGLISVVTVQAVALAWFSALVVMQLVARVRGREWALGRLRGVRRRSWLAAVFGEPALLVVTGAAGGLLVGVLACRVAARWWLVGGGRVDPWRAPVLLAVGLAVLGLAAGLAVASLRSARAPLAVLLWEGADPPRVSRSVAVAEALVVAATAAAVYQLSVGGTLSGSSAGLALLAPGLVATAVGLMAVRLVVGVVRRRTRRPVRTVGGLIVWRQLARTPSGLQRNIVVAIAVALAVFATQLGALSVRNQGLRADAEIGAGTVLHVRVPSGGDLLQIVRSADPAGTSAMAVAERDASNDGGTSRVVAVDTERLARISPWRASWAGLSAAKLTALLRPPAPTPILLRGRQVRLDLIDVGFTAEPGPNGPSAGIPAPDLHLIVADSTRWYDIALGALRAGRETLSAPISCPQQCRIVRLQTQNDGQPTPYTVGFTVTGLSTDRQPPADFAARLRQPDGWRTEVSSLPLAGQGRADAFGDDGGLRLEVTDKAGTAAPAIAPGDALDPLPALLGEHVDRTEVAGVPGAVEGTGFDDKRHLLQVVGAASVVPRALDDGVLVDLGYASARADPALSKASPEVWLTPGAHPAVMRALQAAGVTTVATETLAAQRTALSRTGPARATVVNLALVALAALLVFAVLSATQHIDSARRRRLWSVTRLCGLSRARMTGLVLVEIAGPATAGVALGGGSGVLAILLAGKRVPLFAEHTIGPPLDTHPALGLLALLAVIGVSGILLSAISSAATEARHDRGRE